MNTPRATNGNGGGVFQPPVAMSKANALKHRLVQFNGPKYLSYLVFDIDRAEAALAWQDANLPRPTLIIENPRNTYAHYTYELVTPVKVENKNSARYAYAIRDAMRAALRADPDYRGNLTKNPFHPDWRVPSPDEPLLLFSDGAAAVLRAASRAIPLRTASTPSKGLPTTIPVLVIANSRMVGSNAPSRTLIRETRRYSRDRSST